MPEHVHLLVALTGKIPLGRVIARVKAKTGSTLVETDRNLRWQGNYYEHRLRPDDSIEDVLRYLFLNPYRAGLIAAADTYPWYWMHADEAAWFTPTLNEQEHPFPEWMR